MQFSTLLIGAVTALLGATTVSGKCFQTGENWGDHTVAKRELSAACDQLKGHYGADEIAQKCRAVDGKSFVFLIQNKTPDITEISKDECMRNIGAQIDNCGHGGEITVSGVRFRCVDCLMGMTPTTSVILLTYL